MFVNETLWQLICSPHAGYLEGHPLLDLNFQEDSAGGPDCSVALHPNSDRLVLLQMDARCVFLCVSREGAGGKGSDCVCFAGLLFDCQIFVTPVF